MNMVTMYLHTEIAYIKARGRNVRNSEPRVKARTKVELK